MEQYIKVLKSYKRMPRVLEDYLREGVKPVLFPKGSMLQKNGKTCRHIYFIEKGVVKIADNEKTYFFKKENDFIISYLLADTNMSVARAGVEALEDVTAWDFTPEVLEGAEERFIEIQAHLRLMLEKQVKVSEEINYLLREENSPSQLYDYLHKETPDLLDRVEPKHLASFLGISEQVLLHMKNSNIRTPINMTRRRRKRS